MMPATASAAFCMSSKTAIRALDALGGGTSLRMAWEMTPKVPSDWISMPARL